MQHILLVLLLAVAVKSYGQKEDNVWVVGSMPVCTINFNSSPAIIDTICQPFMAAQRWGGASICDSSGNLLFFSNGTTIYTPECDTLDDGKGFTPYLYEAGQSGGTGFQDNIIVPKKDSTFYLINYAITDSSVVNGLLYDIIAYHIIDMKANGGLGKLVSKNNVLMIDTFFAGSQFTACRHANGSDWWVVKSGLAINKYYKFLVTPDTILGPIIQTISNDTIAYFYGFTGQSVFSQDGTKFAQISPQGKLVILNFDRCTGEFSPYSIFWANYNPDFNLLVGGYGISFSPNGRFIYFNDYYKIYQYDLLEPDTSIAKVEIGVRDTSKPFALFTCEWLAPDGRIYIDNYQGTIGFLHYIENPDIKGVGCNFCQACLPIPNPNARGIQNHINFNLGREIGSACDTIYNDIPKPLSINNTNLTLIPNPANDIVKVDYEDIGNNPAALQVTDALGQVVYRHALPANTSSFSFSTSTFTGGLYTVVVSTSKGAAVGRLSVVH